MEGRLDLNADVGEGFPYDEQLLAVISSANVACGFHAGSRKTMTQVCSWAVERGVAVGAQPSYRDREGFGRRDVEIGFDALHADLCEQIEGLQAVATAVGASVAYVKPHGALYNRAVHDEEHARALIAACLDYALPVLALPGSVLLTLAAEAGVPAFREFFADRAYDGAGRLVARTESGAVITDPEAVDRRVRQLVESSTVLTVDGRVLAVEADSVCVHGDSPGAIDLAVVVRGCLEAAQVDVRAFG